MEAAIRAAGYEPSNAKVDATNKAAARDKEQWRLKRDLLIAAGLTLPIFLLEMGSHLIPALHHWLAMTVGVASMVKLLALVSADAGVSTLVMRI